MDDRVVAVASFTLRRLRASKAFLCGLSAKRLAFIAWHVPHTFEIDSTSGGAARGCRGSRCRGPEVVFLEQGLAVDAQSELCGWSVEMA